MFFLIRVLSILVLSSFLELLRVVLDARALLCSRWLVQVLVRDHLSKNIVILRVKRPFLNLYHMVVALRVTVKHISGLIRRHRLIELG